MTHRPAAASRCKSQFAVTNGKGAVTHRRFMFVIVDTHADALSRSNLLGIVRDGGLRVSIAIDVGDHRGGGRRQCAGVDLVAQRRRKPQRDGGCCLRKDVPRTELAAFRRGGRPPEFLRDVFDEGEGIAGVDPDDTDSRGKPCIGQACPAFPARASWSSWRGATL